jgi:hypothetical protein
MKGIKVFHFLLLLFILGLPLFLWSCYPSTGLDSLSDYDVVATVYDKDANFGSIRTYFMGDTIFHLIPEDAEDEISREFDQHILSEVERNMNAIGYTRVDSTEDNPPNTAMVVAVTTSTYVGYSYWPGYGYPGWGWGYPGYGWGYPGYWTSYSYSTGTIFISLGDPNNPDTQNQIIPLLWNASLNGLLSENRATTRSRITEMINRSFKQSPYLGAK